MKKLIAAAFAATLVLAAGTAAHASTPGTLVRGVSATCDENGTHLTVHLVGVPAGVNFTVSASGAVTGTAIGTTTGGDIHVVTLAGSNTTCHCDQPINGDVSLAGSGSNNQIAEDTPYTTTVTCKTPPTTGTTVVPPPTVTIETTVPHGSTSTTTATVPHGTTTTTVRTTLPFSGSTSWPLGIGGFGILTVGSIAIVAARRNKR